MGVEGSAVRAVCCPGAIGVGGGSPGGWRWCAWREEGRCGCMRVVFGDAWGCVDCGVWGVGCRGLARTFQRVVPLEGSEAMAPRAERVVRRLFVDMSERWVFWGFEY